MTRSASSSTAPHRRGPGLGPHLGLVGLLLVSGVTGCYRAAGVPKNTPIAYEIPATGGDRVAGLKSTGGPGDYYLGNDYVQMAVDGAPYGERRAQMGAFSGGAILDVGAIGLDQSYHRVGLPADNVDQLAPVVNQDPDLPLVFDSFRPSSSGDAAVLEMHGGLMDPKGKLGVPVDANQRVIGVEVVHTITLPGRSSNFDLATTIINHTATPLPIYSIGDYLHQQGGGLRVLVPGQLTSGFTPAGGFAAPTAVTTWGAVIPGSTFTTTTSGVEDPAKRFNPLATAVQAHGLGLQGAEPSAESMDHHQSLGIASLDTPLVLVTSDPQNALLELRPKFPARVVVGKLPDLDGAGLPKVLAAGASLTHNRRLYTAHGTSTAFFVQAGIFYPSLPTQASGPFNGMAEDRALRFGEPSGDINFALFGTATRGGALQTEIRLERLAALASGSTPDQWVVEGVDFWDAGELHSNGNFRPMTLPAPALGAGGLNRYQITLTNRLGSQSFGMLTNTNTSGAASFPSVITPLQSGGFVAGEPIAPEASPSIGGGLYGNIVGSTMTPHYLATWELNSDPSVFQPARVLIQALNASGARVPASDPTLQRTRLYLGIYDVVTKGKIRSTINPGAYQFRAGNQLFGSSFNFVFGYGGGSQPIPLIPGRYRFLASHGPLSPLASQDFSAFPNDGSPLHPLRMLNGSAPAGWVSFDLPSPTQATTGGLVPAEMMASALAENVQVVARTEEDRLTSPSALYNEFRFDFSDAVSASSQRSVVAQDPLVVGARSSTLWSPSGAGAILDGRVTALFTPEPNTSRFGGARDSQGWTLADFIANGDGPFTVVHRPRNPGNGPSDLSVPQGLFTAHNFDPTVALGTGVNAWWNQTGPLSGSKKMGDFDALELIRAEYSDATGPKDLTVGVNATAWFNEFKAVRADWFGILKQQTPGAFTKGLGFSGAKYSLDTPMGLARTYLQTIAAVDEGTMSPVLDALKGGRAVASTGPFIDVSINGQGPGGFVAGTNPNATLSVNVYAADWVPIDEVRIVVNGSVVATIPFNATNFTQDPFDARKWTLKPGLSTITFTPGKDAFVIVEAGVPLGTSGAYAAGTPWAEIMKGIYPLAVTNPIFVDVNGGGYTAPGLP